MCVNAKTCKCLSVDYCMAVCRGPLRFGWISHVFAFLLLGQVGFPRMFIFIVLLAEVIMTLIAQ